MAIWMSVWNPLSWCTRGSGPAVYTTSSSVTSERAASTCWSIGNRRSRSETSFLSPLREMIMACSRWNCLAR